MRIDLVLIAIVLSQGVIAQRPTTADPNRQLVAPVVPAEVQSNRAVRFRFSAPEADAVQVSVGNKHYPMEKDDKGVWSAMVGPLDPENYMYTFDLAGAHVNSGQIEVPASPPLIYQVRDVPHGTVTSQPYFSKVQNRRRRLIVYLPAQYYTEPTRKFPVLYLYHSSNEMGFITGSQADNVLDNFIAEGKAVPTLVVMPNNNINDGTGKDALYPSASDNLAVIEKELQNEIMPMIQKDYRVETDRMHRAITGLSFGGGTAFGMGMKHLELFGYIGEFGTGIFGGADTPPPGHTNYAPFDPDSIAPGLVKKLLDPATKPKVFFMSVGDKDPREPFQKQAYEDFKAKGVDVSFSTFPGGHENKVFRAALIAFLPLLFK